MTFHINHIIINILRQLTAKIPTNMSLFDRQLTEQQLDSLYSWVDSLPLSRSKKNISRDFSDAVLMAETVGYYFPKLVQLHNYPATNSIKSKIQNWKTLSTKVLSKFGLILRDDEIQKIASSVPSMIDSLLFQFKSIIAEQHRERERSSPGPNSIDRKQERSMMMSNGIERLRQENGDQNMSTKKKDDPRSSQVMKVQQLKEILKVLKDKIASVEKNLQRKQAQIKQLEDIIQLGL